MNWLDWRMRQREGSNNYFINLVSFKPKPQKSTDIRKEFTFTSEGIRATVVARTIGEAWALVLDELKQKLERIPKGTTFIVRDGGAIRKVVLTQDIEGTKQEAQQ